MSCVPSCTTVGCAKDHGPICPDGALCQKRVDGNCSLYHKPRDRGNRSALNANSAAFSPSPTQQQQTTVSAQPITTTAQPTTTPPPEQQQQQQQSSPQSNLNSKLNPNASSFQIDAPPFIPPKPFFPQQQPEYDEDEDYDDEDYEDEDGEDDEDEFMLLVEQIRLEPQSKDWSEQEIEALANERFYSKRVLHPPQSTTPTSQPSTTSPTQQQQQTTSATPIQSNFQPFYPTPTSPTQQQQSTTNNLLCQCCFGDSLGCENSTICLTRGLCICVDDEVDHAKLQTWVPLSRNCICCKGFIYRCDKKLTTCVSKGQCDCAEVAKDGK